MSRILVITVTYNAMKWVDRCFGSLRNSRQPVDVFVVDNGSSDGTAEYIRNHFPEVMLHCTGENYGFGKANNIGLEYALANGYDYAYLLNQDAWVFPDTFDRLLEAHDAHPEYGILSPVQMTASMERPDPRFKVKCLDKELSAYESGRIYDVDFVMAAHWLVSRRCILSIGGFSPAFRHYGEDDNFIHRSLWKGFKIGFLAGAYAVHDRELRSTSKHAAMRLKCVASVVKLSNPSSCLPFRLVMQPLELLAIAVRYMSSDVLKFIPSFVASCPKIVKLRRESLEEGAFLNVPNEN